MSIAFDPMEYWYTVYVGFVTQGITMPISKARYEERRFIFEPRSISRSDFAVIRREGWMVIRNNTFITTENRKMIVLTLARWV